MSSDESKKLQKKFTNLKVNTPTEINILLLGETGVGKSTFINSIANYLSFADLKTAKKENLLVLIPSVLKVRDKDGVYQVVKVGIENDQNEYLKTGESATQDIKTYVFPILEGSTMIRLIDTPGMGDTKGVEQDDINCENILSYIGQLHELHAICFLFKPTNTRITAFFDYCIKQILSRLDRTASRNLIFIFTNARGSDYGPGETFSILEKIVKEIKERPPFVDIPLNKNIFCFDNEAFRYLAAKKQSVEFESSVKENNKLSWKKSSEECWRMIHYIVGDAKNAPLKPHHVKNTNAINEARRMVMQLTQPLAEITQLIDDNIHVMERHQQHLTLNQNSLEELRNKLYTPVVNLMITNLTQPVTICASKNCSEIYKVGDKSKHHYKQRCHDPCYLTNVPKEIVGSPELVNCAAINKSNNACYKCGCDFSSHMHVYYMTNTVEEKVLDTNIEKTVVSKEKVMQTARELVKSMSTRKMELENEHKLIISACAKFAHFLQNNAITPFNDSYEEYIEYLLNREKSMGGLCNRQTLLHLQSLLYEYNEQKKSFEEALKMQKDKNISDTLFTAQQIQNVIMELYSLKHNGKKIREMFQCQKKARSKEHRNTEYIHEMPKVKSCNENDKKKKGPFKNKTPIKKEKNFQYKQKQRNRLPPASYEKFQNHSQVSRGGHLANVAHGPRPPYSRYPPARPGSYQFLPNPPYQQMHYGGGRNIWSPPPREFLEDHSFPKLVQRSGSVQFDLTTPFKITPNAATNYSKRLLNTVRGTTSTLSWPSLPSVSFDRTTSLPLEQTKPSPIIPTYITAKKKRGKVLIINNINFRTGSEERKGAEVDGKSIKNLFETMGFNIKNSKNLTATKMLTEVQEFKNDSSLKDVDMTIVVIMSHGINEHNGIKGPTLILGVDGQPLEIDDILEEFSSIKCPSMATKPKIFIFQCCRGNKSEQNTPQKYFTTYKDALHSSAIKNHADVLVAYSTLPGFFSYRDALKGSWYIEAFVEVFKEYGRSEDIETLLKLVNEKLNNKHPTYAQTSSYENRGFKRCFLYPYPSV